MATVSSSRRLTTTAIWSRASRTFLWKTAVRCARPLYRCAHSLTHRRHAAANVLYYDAVVELESGLTAFLGEAYEVYGSPASALRHCALLALASLLFVLA